jgi:ferredoxin-NADP reductase
MDHEAYRGFKLIGITDVNPSTKLFRFAIADNTRKLSISPGKHISVSAVLDGKFTKREYTPITDAPGYFELLIKVL